VSCSWISNKAEDSTTPVNPPIVNKNRNPTTKYIKGLVIVNLMFINLSTQEKILTPVGIAIIIVADVK
jgi:hypothetical protein